jgi:DNA-binding MarR family transcriptional regulator
VTEGSWYQEVPLPQLLRVARDTYRAAVRQALADVGCDDLPRNGVFVLTDLATDAVNDSFSPQADVVASLGLSKQAASQLIDTLVLRDYLERRNDPEDRRRMGVRLTERGRVGAEAVAQAVAGIEAALAELVTADELRALRTALAVYRVIQAESGD